MSTTLNINLPNNWWYNSGNTDNTPQDGFFNLQNVNYVSSIDTFPGFITPYTTGDISSSCSFSNPAYTVDYLTITFTPNNSETGSYFFNFYNFYYSYYLYYYFNWSENMTMKISAKINGSTTTNLIFNVTNIKNTYTDPIYAVNYGTLTLSSTDQVNNTSPSNTVFSSSKYKVYLNSSSAIINFDVNYNYNSNVYPVLSTPYFPIAFDITTSVGTDNCA